MTAKGMYKMMIKFAEYHVEKFREKLKHKGLESITSPNRYTGEGAYTLDTDMLDDFYPLTNIK